ncbi:hypothetical protein [Methylophaga lonarensis]|uniref:hypothetical protein n=1 Tax=Methylophaga lonarensis TaxID=999151 RepID=UPI003D2D4654
MKNKLTDLNDHLFTEMERLCDEDLKGDALKDEISRARAVSAIAANIISNANTAIEGERLRRDGGNIPMMLEQK